eukprot:TRINITY_DN64274_c0_g1_i1.p1 TRINITY_DN64274_c0_g1~~TRINITY_DN64274_c0_g1_i1.p1  ORF type:complete len:572 (+),score=88.62 TRINITY_DN64274_c0_g1_i1:82-1797(+)
MFRAALQNMVSTFTARVSSEVSSVVVGGANERGVPRHVLVMVMLCGIQTLDTYHLFFVALGAAFFWAFEAMQQPYAKRQELVRAKPQRVAGESITVSTMPTQKPTVGMNRGCLRALGNHAKQPLTVVGERQHNTADGAARTARNGKQRNKSSSAIFPVPAPTFTSSDWDSQVDELVAQISPSATCAAVVDQLVSIVLANVRKIAPGVNVVGFVNGDLHRGKAFGVAVPNVDVLISLTSPPIVNGSRQARGISGNSRNSFGGAVRVDGVKLQKAAIRAFTEHLLRSGGFKFRRSAFGGLDPKVTLLSPGGFQGHDEGIPVDIYVNATTPLYNTSMLTDAGSFDSRARELIMLVRRWSKDRGVCHAARGHLSPYVWNLLTIYFLQAGTEERILPPLGDFPLTSRLAGGISDISIGSVVAASRSASRMPLSASNRSSTGGTPPETTGSLFQKFFTFYGKHFQWGTELVSVRCGQRWSTDMQLRLHVSVDISALNGNVGPIIEDPFDTKRNLAACMTVSSLARLQEELTRAVRICTNTDGAQGLLTELLQPWTPPRQDQEPAFEFDEKPAFYGDE